MRSGRTKRPRLLTSLMLLLAISYQVVWGQTIKQIYEETLYDNITQSDRSYLFYQFVVGQRYYADDKHVVVKVMADGYDSDPDVFISKTNSMPKDSSSSDWFCEREGSETCVIHAKNVELGNTFYVGVRCQRECQYKLKVAYSSITSLAVRSKAEEYRDQLRFDGYSTQILKYWVPPDVGGVATKAVTLKVVPEDTYTPVEVYLSLDANFYLIEEKPAEHLIENGMGIAFGASDFSWCTNCYIYLIVNIFEESRYYAVTELIGRSKTLTENFSQLVMINPFQQTCLDYFVLRAKEDVRLDIQAYTGIVDFYASARVEPDSPEESNIQFRASHGASQSMILSVQDRINVGITTGSFFFCMYALTPFSGRIIVNENTASSRYDVKDGQTLSKVVDSSSYFFSGYSNSDLKNSGTLKVLLIPNYLQEEDATDLPKLFYKICPVSDFSNCNLEGDETTGNGLTEISTRNEDFEISGSIEHDPDNCQDKNVCMYTFLVTNPTSSKVSVGLRVKGEFYNPGDVLLTRIYKNTVSYGESITYELNQNTNKDLQPYLQKLNIKLESVHGDADLFVSVEHPYPTIENSEFQSRRSTKIDMVTLEEQGGESLINRPIYISVFGNTLTQYYLTFEYETKAEYDSRLEDATALSEGKYLEEKFNDEYEEGFYKFHPWWTVQENRTVVLLADVLINKIYMMSSFSKYPKTLNGAKKDHENAIVIYGSQEPTLDTEFGNYFLRVLPNFALYDLISSREYMFNLYSFSMAPPSDDMTSKGFDVLEVGQDKLGFTNKTYYQDYQFYQLTNDAEYDITLTRLPGMGKPVFFVSIIRDSEDQPARLEQHNFKSTPHETRSTSVQTLTITGEMMVQREAYCGIYHQSVRPDGSKKCVMSIAVICQDESQCAYKLRIDQKGVDSTIVHSEFAQDTFTATPPGSILTDSYINGEVAKSKVRYYFFPFNPEESQIMILLNKTQMYSKNGDSKMLALLQPDINEDDDDKFRFSKWTYPTSNYYGAQSMMKDSSAPEIIEPCPHEVQRVCQGKQGCGMIIGVVGLTKNTDSTFRLKGFLQKDKITLKTPIKQEISALREGKAAYDYYWFLVNDTVADSSATFDYEISVNTNSDSNNPDLFVSLMDGRSPTEFDYDLMSNQVGADSIRITSDDPIWKRNGWKTSAGVVVIVGVKQETAGTYTLILNSAKDLAKLKVTEISGTEAVVRTLDQGRTEPYEEVFKLYNFGHRLAQLTLISKKGKGTLMYAATGQKDIKNNIYTAIPINEDNSEGYAESTPTSPQSLDIDGSKCYTCLYMIKVRIEDPATDEFILSVSRSNEEKQKFLEVKTDVPSSYRILASSNDRRKFILHSTSSFTLEVEDQAGEITVYVGLDPNTVGPNAYIWKANMDPSSKIARLDIKTPDINFHLDTWYYVYIVPGDIRDSFVTVTLTQQKNLEFIPNNYDQKYGLQHASTNEDLLNEKFQYQSSQEQVKFFLFEAPGALKNSVNGMFDPRWYKIHLFIDGLTPHFYPYVLLEHHEFQPQDLQSLSYPTMESSDFQFGTNPLEQLHKTSFKYEAKIETDKETNYFTMAVFQQNWGLTDILKSEFQIRVEVEFVGRCDVQDCSSSTPSVQASMMEVPFSSTPLMELIKEPVLVQQ